MRHVFGERTSKHNHSWSKNTSDKSRCKVWVEGVSQTIKAEIVGRYCIICIVVIWYQVLQYKMKSVWNLFAILALIMEAPAESPSKTCYSTWECWVKKQKNFQIILCTFNLCSVKIFLLTNNYYRKKYYSYKRKQRKKCYIVRSILDLGRGKGKVSDNKMFSLARAQ